MNIKDCHFTSENIMFAISDGKVYLFNKESRILYKVSVVKKTEPVIYGGAKTIKIKRIFNKENK